MKKSKKIFTAISLGILSAFVSGAITASAAELVVTNGPESMTSEQKAEWVDDTKIYHKSSLKNNRIELSGDFGDYSVFGASISEENKNVANNVVVIGNSGIGKCIAGGYSEYGNAYNNKVVLKGIKMSVGNYVENYVKGGYAKGTANGNSVTIDGFSGYVKRVIGGEAYQVASNNTVNLSNIGNAAVVEIPSLDMTSFDSIMGGDGEGVVANNKVIISGDNGF